MKEKRDDFWTLRELRVRCKSQKSSVLVWFVKIPRRWLIGRCGITKSVEEKSKCGYDRGQSHRVAPSFLTSPGRYNNMHVTITLPINTTLFA